MGRGLHGGDQRLAREFSLEAAKILRGDDDDFVTPVHCHVLRPFAADAPHQLAEPRLGILQQPVARTPTTGPTICKTTLP